MNEIQRKQLTISAEDNKVIKRLKTLTFDCNGTGFMPVLKGNPIPFWLSSSGEGFEVNQIKNFIMKWDEFSEIVKEAISHGGKCIGEMLPHKAGKKSAPQIYLKQ